MKYYSCCVDVFSDQQMDMPEFKPTFYSCKIPHNVQTRKFKTFLSQRLNSIPLP
jgi:hypothetical protein